MPIKLVGTIILILIVAIFAGVNLDNKCDISFLFYTQKDVPVFLTVIVSFAIGAVVMLPFTLGLGKKKSQKSEPKVSPESKPKSDSSEADSKTLFDFKIKREVAPNKPKEKGEKKGLFGLGKKKEASKKSESKPENSTPADDASTGAPV